jgi:acetyltransferase-like isoleucine patch superfamily enzyme
VIQGENNQVLTDGADVASLTFDVKGNDNTIIIRPGAVVRGRINIQGNGHRLDIGERSRIHPACSIVFEDDRGTIEIGHDTEIHSQSLMASLERCTLHIGSGCLFAAECILRTSDSHAILDERTGERINSGADIFDDDHVWMCFQAAVMKGVRIGSDVVVGTRSVVTGDIPPRCVVAGYPARVVRTGTVWKAERF